MFWAVIMAGGSGTRFWPESRNKLPKQFLSFFSKKTLLEETVDRLKKVIPVSRILIVIQKNKTSLIRKTLKHFPAAQIIGEPVARNTAPCAAVAAAWILKRDPDAVIGLFPADHYIQKAGVFSKALKAAASLAQSSGMPVTFGIRPEMPHTGYGYLELGKSYRRVQGFKVSRLKQFREKPTEKRAVEYCRSARFLWNSGMFVWKASELLNAFKRHMPQAHRLALLIAGGNLNQKMAAYFSKMPSISIDYGVMEKMKGKILAIPLDIGWSDVGSWQGLSGLFPKDSAGNLSLGRSLMVRSSNNFVKSKQRLVVLLDVDHLAVVDSPDAILVCPKNKTEAIRDVVQALKKSKLHGYL